MSGTALDATVTLGYTLASQLSSRSTTNTDLGWWTAPTKTQVYVADGLNRYSSVNGTSYTHDTRGNLTGDGSRTFVYDVENRLTSVSGTSSMTLTYDPLGRLRQTTSAGVSTDYVYDGDRLTMEYNGATILRRYVHGSAVDEPIVWYEGNTLATRRWLHQDERGSIIAYSDGTGAATAYKYGPYGEQNAGDAASWTGSRFRYTGQIMLPEVQLYHYKARVYDPGIGRFLQTDPIGYDDDFNLYAYTGNDSLNFHDSDGEGKEVSLKLLMARGVIIRNASLANDVHKATGIPFSAKGFPIFNSVAVKTVYLPGGFTGRAADAAAANAKAGLKETPKDMTWHHHEDMHTMQLVPRSIHTAVGHTGGTAITRALKGLVSDPSVWAGLVTFGGGLFLTSSDAGACSDRGCEYQETAEFKRSGGGDFLGGSSKSRSPGTSAPQLPGGCSGRSTSPVVCGSLGDVWGN